MAGGRLWELDEDARVRAAPRGGLRDLACELGRTYGAVKQRARSAAHWQASRLAEIGCVGPTTGQSDPVVGGDDDDDVAALHLLHENPQLLRRSSRDHDVLLIRTWRSCAVPMFQSLIDGISHHRLEIFKGLLVRADLKDEPHRLVHVGTVSLWVCVLDDRHPIDFPVLSGDILVTCNFSMAFRNPPSLCFYGSPGRARTADLVINSHPLYQLSYRGMRGRVCYAACGNRSTR